MHELLAKLHVDLLDLFLIFAELVLEIIDLLTLFS